MKRIVAFALLLSIVAMPAPGQAAQTEVPATTSPGCTAEPMSQERIEELAAMAAASPDAGLPIQAVTLPDGTPITADLQAQLLETLFQINACSWAGDLPRLLSLYSERFIVAQFFAPETVPIVPAPDRTPERATPAPMPTDQQPMILAAVQLPDGRIAALVSPNAWGGDQQVVWFVQQDGRWLVDMTSPAAESEVGGVESDVPMEAQPVVDLVIQDAATQLGVDPSALNVTELEAVEWPDSSLGCPEDGGVYAQVISPGYRIVFTDGDALLEYHTGPNDLFIYCTM